MCQNVVAGIISWGIHACCSHKLRYAGRGHYLTVTGTNQTTGNIPMRSCTVKHQSLCHSKETLLVTWYFVETIKKLNCDTEICSTKTICLYFIQHLSTFVLSCMILNFCLKKKKEITFGLSLAFLVQESEGSLHFLILAFFIYSSVRPFLKNLKVVRMMCSCKAMHRHFEELMF